MQIFAIFLHVHFRSASNYKQYYLLLLHFIHYFINFALFSLHLWVLLLSCEYEIYATEINILDNQN